MNLLWTNCFAKNVPSFFPSNGCWLGHFIMSAHKTNTLFATKVPKKLPIPFSVSLSTSLVSLYYNMLHNPSSLLLLTSSSEVLHLPDDSLEVYTPRHNFSKFNYTYTESSVPKFQDHSCQG